MLLISSIRRRAHEELKEALLLDHLADRTRRVRRISTIRLGTGKSFADRIRAPVGTNDRTPRKFRRTGILRWSIFDAIAREMGTTGCLTAAIIFQCRTRFQSGPKGKKGVKGKETAGCVPLGLRRKTPAI